MVYIDNNYFESKRIQLEDRTMLCAGISQIFATLPQENWDSSMSSLTLPTIECMESLSQVLAQDRNDQYILRLEDEICVLASTLRSFHRAISKASGEGKITAILLSLLHRAWPCVKYIAKALRHQHSIVSSLSDFLKVVVSLDHNVNDILILKEACDVANTIMNETAIEGCGTDVISPILDFIEDTVDNFGHLVELHLMSRSMQDNTLRNEICKIIQDLIESSYEVFLMKQDHFRSTDDAVPGIFCVLRVSMKRCPHLFFGLRTKTGDEIFTSSLNAADHFMNCDQADVIREAILFSCDAVCIVLV